MIRLTKEEIIAEHNKNAKWAKGNENLLECEGAVAQAQLKKVIEWRNAECTEHNHTINISGFNHKVIVMHNDCEKCWQGLLGETK